MMIETLNLYNLNVGWKNCIVKKTLELDYKSCEMICDDLAQQINNKYPKRKINITVSEDGENGATIQYTV